MRAVASKAKELPVLYYRKLPGVGYLAYTESDEVRQELEETGIRFAYEKPLQCFAGLLERVPRSSPSFLAKRHNVGAPTKASQQQLEALYERYLKMVRVREKMDAEIEKAERRMVALLQEHGLQLKPGAPLDTQLLSRPHKTRLHYQEALHQMFHLDAMKALASRYPILKKFILTRTEQYIDRQGLKKALPSLPPLAVSKIMSLDRSYSFVQTPLRKPGCSYCGGKMVRGTKTCKRCGL